MPFVKLAVNLSTGGRLVVKTWRVIIVTMAILPFVIGFKLHQMMTWLELPTKPIDVTIYLAAAMASVGILKSVRLHR